jgi:hypothetical protein
MANHLANGLSVYLETIFPYAEDEQLKDFAEVLIEWKQYPPTSKAGKIMADNVREWVTFFEDQAPDVTPRTRRPSDSKAEWTEPDRTKGDWTTPGTTTKVGGYEATFLGPPIEEGPPAWFANFPDPKDTV